MGILSSGRLWSCVRINKTLLARRCPSEQRLTESRVKTKSLQYLSFYRSFIVLL